MYHDSTSTSYEVSYWLSIPSSIVISSWTIFYSFILDKVLGVTPGVDIIFDIPFGISKENI